MNWLEAELVRRLMEAADGLDKAKMATVAAAESLPIVQPPVFTRLQKMQSDLRDMAVEIMKGIK